MVSRTDFVQSMLLEEDYSILYIARSLDSTIQWLMDHNLVFSNPICAVCQNFNMHHIKDTSKADKLRLRCSNKNCLATKSFRWKSFFEDHKLSLMELVQIMFHYFIRNDSMKEISKHLPAKTKAISNVYSKLRTAISDYMEALKLGGQLGIERMQGMEHGIVEIDETLMTHYNGQQMWVFGIFDRVTKELRCFAVQDRSRESLIPIIKEHVVPGAKIYSDGWLAYHNLEREGYRHTVVLHVDGFGSGSETTNGIESCWSELKRLTKQDQGIQLSDFNPLNSLQEYVNVGTWRRMSKGQNLIGELIDVIKYSYF